MAVVGGLMLAACGGSATSEESVRPLDEVAAPPTTAPPPTTVAPTTTEPDEWAIPNDPDAAYFERVLNEFLRTEFVLMSDLASGEFSEEAIALLEASRTAINRDFWLSLEDPDFTTQIPSIFTLEAQSGLSGVELEVQRGSCAVVTGVVSYDGVFKDRSWAPELNVFVLERSTPDSLNPTGWILLERQDGNTDLEIGCAA